MDWAATLQAFVTAQQLILEQKEAQLKGLEAEVGTLKVAMAAAEEEDRERTEDYEAHCADLEVSTLPFPPALAPLL